MTTQRHSNWFKAGYGSLEMGVSAMELLIQVYLMEFYVVILKLNPFLAGLALAVAVVWDAVTDPVLGWISDNTRTRFGRRLPYIFAGLPLFAVSFYLLFNPPLLNSQAALFSFLLITYLLTNTFMTLVSVPHTTLAGELTNDRNERTSFFGWRLIFANLGLLAGLVLPALVMKMLAGRQVDTLADETYLSRGLSAALIVVLTLLASLPTLYVLIVNQRREKTVGQHQFTKKITGGRSVFRELKQNLLRIHNNRIFIILAVTFMILAIGRTLNASLALFYYKFHLNLPEHEVLLFTLGLFFVVIMSSVVFWLHLSKNYGKKVPAMGGMIALGIMTCVMYPIIPQGLLWPTLIASVIGGVAAGAVVLIESLVADSIDWDELRSGQQNQGVFFGYWRMTSKISRALGLLLSGILLSLIGFDPEASTQMSGVGIRLSYLFGPGVGLFFLLGALMLAFLPWNEGIHNRIQALLLRRQRIRSSQLT